MKLTEIRQLLDTHQIRLTKSLGQNFLHDGNQLRRMIAVAEVARDDPVLEIGPGLGPLTELLLAKAKQVLAIEKDRRLVNLLERRMAAAPNLTLVHDDALDFLRRDRRDWSAWKVVANVPYSITSPLMVELALTERGPERLVVTLQLEVLRRLLAEPGTADFGALTLLVGLQYEPRDWFKIPAACFFPAPDVESACVCLTRRSRPLLGRDERATFVRLVKRAFTQRRKMMLKLPKEEWPVERLHAAFAQVGLIETVRAEAVSLEQFVKLTQALHTGARDS
ncbi:MAG: ribosomal RNA small subunit methyltransferase A [Verrucomicrobia bacterium]|nr:ribosomal RNA small subunit methyltransferase A [Verrucomicrobiota bacterium]